MLVRVECVHACGIGGGARATRRQLHPDYFSGGFEVNKHVMPSLNGWCHRMDLTF